MRFKNILLPLLLLALAAPALAQTPADAATTPVAEPSAAPARETAPVPEITPTTPVVPTALTPALTPAAPVVATSHGSVNSFGEDVFVPSGQVVDEVSSFGGDVVIEGRVLHDVSSFGGDVTVNGSVDGDVASMGGEVDVPGSVRGDITSAGGDVRVTGQVGGEVGTFGGDFVRTHSAHAHAGPHIAPVVATGFWGTLSRWVSLAASRALSALFVFLLGLVLLGLAPERLRRLETAMVEAPSRVAAHGLVVVVLSALAMVVMVLSILGIPAALLFGMIFPMACYVGLAASARVVGALMPTEKLRGKPVVVLAAGVAVLYAASLVPFVGDFSLAAAIVFGLGALSLTRFGVRDVEVPVDRSPAGPFRTRAAEA